MDIINLVLPIIVALIAVGVSVFNLLLIRKDIYTKTIATERIKWANTVRQLIANFIEVYVSDSSNEHKLVSIKSHIELFLNPKDNPDHSDLSNILNNHLDDRNLTVNELTAISQIVFKNSWETMKDEAGGSKKKDEKRREVIYPERNK